MTSALPRPALRADTEVVIGPEHKAFPAPWWGRAVGELATAEVRLSQFTTPVLGVDAAIIQRNLATMQDWATGHGLQLAPHGKTTMAPRLWQQMLAGGAVALTLATPWQVQLARAAGVRAIMLANTLVDPVGIRWLSAELDADPDFRFTCWVDSLAAVRRLEEVRHAAGARRPMAVIVELGGNGGRTGVRTRAGAIALARAVADSATLRLVGCGGYEGALAHDRSEGGLAAVRSYLRELADLHAELAAAEYYDLQPGESAVVTAGGSAYPDLVAAELAELARPAGPGPATAVVLRSGAYLIHDDGFYRGISPLDGAAPAAAAPRLAAAMHAWVTIVSRPEPGLAIFDAGKRDLPFDEGLPVPQAVLGGAAAANATVLAGAEVTALNDQHGFLRLGPEADLPVGTVLRLGLSHPCTAFDKWRLIPVLADHTAADPRVLDAVVTYF